MAAAPAQRREAQANVQRSFSSLRCTRCCNKRGRSARRGNPRVPTWATVTREPARGTNRRRDPGAQDQRRWRGEKASNLELDVQIVQAREGRRQPAADIAGEAGQGALPSPAGVARSEQLVAAKAERQSPQVTAAAHAVSAAMDRAGAMVGRDGLFSVGRSAGGGVEASQPAEQHRQSEGQHQPRTFERARMQARSKSGVRHGAEEFAPTFGILNAKSAAAGWQFVSYLQMEGCDSLSLAATG